jgi:competence protein ComEA
LSGAPAKSPSLTHRININKASAAELELLPHIGPSMAKRILDYRTLHGPFKSIADLDKVKGIGPKTLAKIAPLVTVE